LPKNVLILSSFLKNALLDVVLKRFSLIAYYPEAILSGILLSLALCMFPSSLAAFKIFSYLWFVSI
jgi:hypothetical protein